MGYGAERHFQQTLLRPIAFTLSGSVGLKNNWFITGFVTRLTRRVPLCGAGTAYPSGAHEFIPGF